MGISVSVIATVVGLCLLSFLIFVIIITRMKLDSRKHAKNTKQSKICLPLPNYIPTTISYISVSPTRLSSGEIDLEMINPELYQDMGNIDQEEIKPPSPGRLCFTVDYEEQTEKLVVAVIRGQNIRPKTSNSTTTPCVKICLLPDKRKKCQTKARQKTSDPVFNEEFVFHCSITELRRQCLKFTVCDLDRFFRQNVIGTVMFPLNENYERILTSKGSEEEWRDIDDLGSDSTCFGSILLSLQYLPTAQRLALVILKGKCFGLEDAKNLSIYVKIIMIHGGKTTRGKKTTKVSDADPVFNESFHFDIPEGLLDRTSFVVAVNNKKNLIGKVVVGPNLYATGTGLTHWNDMINSPRNAVAMWHTLY